MTMTTRKRRRIEMGDIASWVLDHHVICAGFMLLAVWNGWNRFRESWRIGRRYRKTQP